MNNTIELSVKLETETCCNCGTPFAIHAPLRQAFLDNGSTFYCPNGHPQHYTKPTKKRLAEAQKELARLREANEWYSDEYTRHTKELKTTKNKLRGQKAAHTRLKNRIANGVCPCCNRQFVNLHRHMETQHPDYKGEIDSNTS